ncbi:MAG: DUF2061 domain-containing protein [Leptonema sp. (in: bacteria)]
MFIQKTTKKKEKKLSLNTKPIIYKDSHYRSLIKGISWRITGTIDTILLSWIITGQIKFALTIGLAETITKIILYYLHERIWEKIKLGKTKEPPIDYEI